MKLKDVKTIYFDYDGTLHDSLAIYEPAFLETFQYLVENNHVKAYTWTSKEISRFLGQTPKEMWDSFGKGLSEEIKNQASLMISKKMEALIYDQKAVLYEGALKTLSLLKQRGYRLIFISNCKQYYLDAHAHVFGLDLIFEKMLCSETYDVQEKHLVLNRIIDEYPGPSAIIGDRHHDMQAGTFNNIYKIGCRYGFGDVSELEDADFIINDIRELTSIFEGLN